MRRLLRNALRRYARNERGNIAILFGFSVVPLMLIMGGAIDLTRFARYKAELSNVVDSAALALGRNADEFDEDEAQEFVDDYVATFAIADDEFTITLLDVEENDTGYQISTQASMETMFLPIGMLTNSGKTVMSMNMNLLTEVRHASNRVELALVLDNTGSMNCAGAVSVACASNWSAPPADSRITALKNAATTLVNTLMKDDMEDPDQIKIALVPFEGMVNVGYRSGPSATPAENWVTPPSWIEWNDQAQAHWAGMNFNKWNFTASPPAACAVGSTLAACKYVGPKWLYNKLNVAWEGCVEMRNGDYELSDDPPDANADSLYVPYFAPDEADSSTTVGSSGLTRVNSDSNGAASGGTNYASYFLNDYLKDVTAPTGTSGVPILAQKLLPKYTVTSPTPFHTGRNDTTFPYEYGPNRGCPRPIVPLTNADSKSTITTAIDGMKAYWHSGTFIPAGLLWGWHVLSSGEPFTQGIAEGDEEFEDTIKAIVLLTDGDNQVQPGDVNPNNSNYTSYGYVNTQDAGGNRRLSSTASASEGDLDEKLEDLCGYVKTDGGIRLYTITFGSLSTDTQTMMSDCATVDDGEPLHYHAPTSADLEDIFHEIGEDLSELYLSM